MTNPLDPLELARLKALESEATSMPDRASGDESQAALSRSDLIARMTPEELAAHKKARHEARLAAAAARREAETLPTVSSASSLPSGDRAAPTDRRASEAGSNSRAQPRDGVRDLEPIVELAPLPQQGRSRSLGPLISFMLCVALPVAAAAVYFFAYASNQYVAEFRFVVRDAKSPTSGGLATGLPALMSLTSAAPSSVDNYLVAEYLLSRQAVEAVQKKLDLRAMYGRDDIDWLARLGARAPIEKLVAYWRRMVVANYDQVTGLGHAQVRAFTPEDAYAIAAALVAQSEELVNGIVNRPLRDAVRFAENDVKRAEDRLQKARTELSRFRNAEQVIEPQSNAVSPQVFLAQNLRLSLATLETERAMLSRNNVSPAGPAATTLDSRIKATRDQLASVESEVGKARDGKTPLAKVVGEYEGLDLERQFAQAMLTASMQALEQARSTAFSQQIYVTTFVDPGLPESSTYPRRISAVLLVALAATLFWAAGMLIVGSVREHLT